MSYPRLSALTPAVVDSLFNIDGARSHDAPTFLWLVGAPGAGKSSGHARAIEAGLIPAGDYATINLDTLLESLAPFQAASSMAHYFKQGPAKNVTKFASIFAYGTRKENLGLFKWYNAAHEGIAAADPNGSKALDPVREEFRPLSAHEAPERLLDITTAAINRAIRKRVNIVYEATLSLTKAGRVTKVDEIMAAVEGTPYRVAFFHIRADPEAVAARVRARQEFEMPYGDPPFYRYVSPKPEAAAELTSATAAAFAAVAKQYAGRALFDEFENPMDPGRLPQARPFDPATQARRIRRAFLTRRSSNRTLSSGWRVSTPRRSSSHLFRLSSSTNRKTRRKTATAPF